MFMWLCCLLSDFVLVSFFFSSRRRHTSCALVTGVQTCALPIYPEVQMGPLVSAGHRGKVAACVDLARSEGGTILVGGTMPDEQPFDKGMFYMPTIVDGLSNASRSAQEEIFGPVQIGRAHV